ncbi:MAG TPA: sensor histidine kinase [Lachnospiraceae bacterium]|nr:sensor histidine kinase [Lachnospiraceae bacterium]
MFFKNLSFQKKLYISCFFLNLLLLSVCSLVFYYYTTASLRNNMQDTIISNTSMLMKDLDSLLGSANNTLKELQTNTDLIPIAKTITDSPKNYFATHVSDRTVFQNTFRSVLVSQEQYGSISYVSRYYDNIGAAYPTGAYEYFSKEKVLEIQSLTDLMENTAFVTYVPPHEDYWWHGETVFSVVRSMRDTFRQYGIIILDFNIASLEGLLSDFENSEDYFISILDPEQNLVYTGSENMDPEKFSTAYRESAQSRDRSVFFPDEFTISGYEVSPTTGWTFILSTNTAGYLASLKNALTVSAVLFLSLFLVMSSFLFLVTLRLSRPLKQLSDQLMHLEPGRNIHISQISGNDEIATLTNAVQVFLAEIYDQNQRLTEARRRTLQAHYDAMEAQLNPHFLYNTLSVIGMAGLGSGSMTVSTMCGELANLLRYSLSYTGQPVLLEQEIANADSYLYIMKMRYEDGLDYDWTLDDSLNTVSVPKLILQPLIENCFQHGFQQAGQEPPLPWKIHIASSRNQTHWFLSVSNNGSPFKEEKLQQLRLRLAQFELPDYPDFDFENVIRRQGFGLENTILRLNIYYRGKAYFNVSVNDSHETTVTIGGPLKPQKTFIRT